MTKKLHELEQFRLDHDLSFQQLAIVIERAVGHKRNPDCWRRICQQTATPNSRTQNLITRFLAARQDEEAATARKRRVS